MNDVAKQFNVTEHFIGNTEWLGASWQDDEACWSVRLKETSKTGRTFTHQCKILISAVGGLSNPNECTIPGIDNFKGDIVHTAKWDPDISCAQKNVIVIGNGSSATQVIPEIAKEAKTIIQFIRTPQYYMPSQNAAVSPFWKAIFRKIPGSLRLFRTLIFLYLESSILLFDLTWLGAKMRKGATTKAQCYVTDHAPSKTITPDPNRIVWWLPSKLIFLSLIGKYWPLLFPNYEFGCKRRVFDNDGYLACLHKSNVHLTSDTVVSLLEQSILTKSGEIHPADVIILATGFSPTQHDVDLRGRNGYVDLVIRAIKPVLWNNASTVEVKQTSEGRFNNELRTALRTTILTDMCRSVRNPPPDLVP
ncbi:FAD/NAD(P)-binding domain-containing protein [Penicillium canescens]|nr:FAD/NAD(P)-binding domain-containing protein [Penicillium canescens]